MFKSSLFTSFHLCPGIHKCTVIFGVLFWLYPVVLLFIEDWYFVIFQAQGNLNNCLLSNTTILAEFASDAEVKQVMGQPSQTAPPTPAPNNNSAWGGSGRGSTPTSQPSSGSKVDSWGNGNGAAGLWSTGPAVGTSLWGGGALADADQHRSTPSSLKPYLPDGLLTSESI